MSIAMTATKAVFSLMIVPIVESWFVGLSTSRTLTTLKVFSYRKEAILVITERGGLHQEGQRVTSLRKHIFGERRLQNHGQFEGTKQACSDSRQG